MFHFWGGFFGSLGCATLGCVAVLGSPVSRSIDQLIQHEVDLGAFHIHFNHAHLHAVTETIALPGALAEQLMFGGIKLEIILAEFGYMHQPFDYKSSSDTNMPKLVTDETVPVNTLPKWSRM